MIKSTKNSRQDKPAKLPPGFADAVADFGNCVRTKDFLSQRALAAFDRNQKVERKYNRGTGVSPVREKTVW